MTENIQHKDKINNQSFHALQFIAKNQNLFPSEVIPTLLVIAAHLPNSHPPIELISEICGRSKRTIIRDIKKLENLRLLSVTKHFRNANIYKLNLSNLVDNSVLNGAIAVSHLNNLNSAKAVSPDTDRIVPKKDLNSDIAMALQDTNKKKYIKKENINSFFNFLSNEEFLNLIALHPKGNKATDQELEALYRTQAKPEPTTTPQVDSDGNEGE